MRKCRGRQGTHDRRDDCAAVGPCSFAVDVGRSPPGRLTLPNTFYGSSWLLPAEVMGWRVFKFGAQIDF